MIDNTKLGSSIREARKQARLTQIELAEKTGLALNSIRRYESGERSPRATDLQKIMVALGDCAALVRLPRVIEISSEPQASSTDSLAETYKAFMDTTKKIGEIAKGSLSEQLYDHFDKLNDDGQEEAVKDVRRLTEIPRFQKRDGE